MGKRSPCPYITQIELSFENKKVVVSFPNFQSMTNDGMRKELEANASFIVRACNSHDELVDVLKDVAKKLERPVRAFGMETYFAEANDLDDLLCDVRKAIIKAEASNV